MTPVPTTLRAGSVPYLVGRPVDLGLGEEAGVELELAVPARLVAGLRDGSLDVALVSTIELFRQPGYSYVDGPLVAGEGYVSSVQVFLHRELPDVRTVALDPASRTAATLSQVVWPGDPARRPEFRETAPGADPRAAGCDAWLRIGDAALHELAAPGAPPVFNPSQAWRERTGLPFAFAAWIGRPGVDLAPWGETFVRARERGAAAAEELVRQACDAWGLDPDATRRYLLEECTYDLGERLTPALLAFRDAAAALGLARGDLEPRAVPVGSASR